MSVRRAEDSEDDGVVCRKVARRCSEMRRKLKRTDGFSGIVTRLDLHLRLNISARRS